MRSFITCLFLASGYLRTAFADSITQPRVPETVRAGGTTTFFATVNSDTTGRRIYGSLIELMYGPSASLGNEVADIVAGNGGIFSKAYKFPKSLSPGTYHLRLSCTTNSTSTNSPQSLQIRSGDIQVTEGQFDCQRPPAWRNVTSTTDASYTGLYVTTPEPGDVRRASATGALTSWVIGWLWRDERNEFGRGIDNFNLEFVQEDGNGGYKVLKTAENPDVTVTSHLFNLDNVTFVPGAYNIRVTYTNVFPEGTTPVGQTVTYVSDPFYVSGSGGECVGLQGGSPSSGGNSSGGPGGNGGSTSGGGSNNGGSTSGTTSAPSSQSTGAAYSSKAPFLAASGTSISFILFASYIF